MKRALICTIVPNDLVHLLNSPQAANTFCFDLIKGGCFDTVYSIVPPSYCDDRIQSNKVVRYFTRKRRKNRFAVLFDTILSNVSCSLFARSSDSIWFYNIVKTNLLCYLLLRYVFRRKTYVILLDHTPTKNKLSFQYYIPHLIKKSYGVISLSSRTDITHPNMDCIAGIVPADKLRKEIRKNDKKLKFLFSGILGKHTGFDLAIEVFKQMIDCELYVTGFGDLSGIDFEGYENIHYLGYLPYDEYLQLYDMVDVCLSFRNPSFAENKNNFPSKILEYFSYNKIVVSTVNYPELIDFKYFICNYTLESIKNTIDGIVLLSMTELLEFRNNSSVLINNFSESRWIEAFTNIEKSGNGI